MSPLLTLISVSGLLDLAIKSAAVMLLAVVVAALLGRASAAWRHLVWCLSVTSLLLLPALSLALPAWQVAWLPQWTAEQTPLAATGQTTQTQTNHSEPSVPAATTMIVAPTSSAPTPSAPPSAATEPLPTTNIETANPQRGPWPWLAIGWATGALLSLALLGIGLVQLAALHRRSRIMGDARRLKLLDELRRQLAVRRSVELRQCEAALAPLTWGALRPVLLVPAEASDWTGERWRLVLLHELAHVRRWDWVTQLVAHVACALYWFNPLVWLAARQMRIERERACDDLVLACGARASDYAQELLALAAGLSNSRLSALVAVPMARRGVLEDRLRGILDSSRSQAAVTTAAICLGAALAAAAIAPLAMLRAAPPESAESKTEEPKQEPVVKEQPAEKPAAKTVTIRGKVVDDATGEPIGQFKTQGGKLNPDLKRMIWGWHEKDFSKGDGSFSTTIGGEEGWTARIVAGGYFPQPVITGSPPTDKEELEVTIRLKRVPDKVRGVVLDHAGKPIKGAAVFAVPLKGLNLWGGQAWSRAPDGFRDDSARPVLTDEQGRFELPTGDALSLAVSHAQFDAWPAAIPPSGEITIRLPEPARVEINLDIDGADKESVIFYQLLSHLVPEFAVGDRGGSTGCVQSERWVPIANPGKLSLAALPPGKYQLARQGGIMIDRQIFEVKSGETKTFDFVRGKGARVRGKVSWPADAKLTGIFISVLSEKSEVFASMSPGGDGAFVTERIPPGSHQLIAYAFEEQTPERLKNTSPIPPSYEAQIRIDVPADGEVKGADLVLKPIPGREPKQEPPAKEKPAAEKPALKPAEAAAAPQKNPLLGEEAAERVKQFPPSFSKSQEGLEVGIAIASDRRAFHEGERVPLEFVIRNVSQKTLRVEHGLYPPETPPTVIGADGKQPSIEAIYLLGKNRRYRDILKPNEVAVYQHMGLGLGEKPNPPGTFWHPFLNSADAVPGKYRLSQQARVTVREEGQDAGTAFHAATGEVLFEIVPADPKKGAAKPVEKPVDKPSEKPAEKPAAKPAKPAPTTVIVQGKVVDDATGEKIDRFVTQGGKFDPVDPTKVTWGTWELRTLGPADWFQAEIRWGEGLTARIVADGYLPEPVLTSAPPDGKKIVEVTVRLKRGRKVRGVVLDHTGKPLKDAAVYAIGPTVLNVAAGEVLSPDGAKPARTDEQGRFELPAGDAKSLAVSHPQLDAWPAIIPDSGEVTVRLPEPARVEINLDIDGADKESNIYYELIVSQMPEFRARVQEGVLRCDRYVKIANPGKLVLSGMTPGKYQLSRRPGRMLENQMFEIKSGEVKTIDYIRKTGARVRGKLTWPADAKLYDITVTMTGEPFQKSPWSDHQWATVYAALTPAEDGTFLTERIPPGTYELAAYAYAPSTGKEALYSGFGGLSVPSFYAAVTIKVPAEGEVKVDDLELKSSRAGK